MSQEQHLLVWRSGDEGRSLFVSSLREMRALGAAVEQALMAEAGQPPAAPHPLYPERPALPPPRLPEHPEVEFPAVDPDWTGKYPFPVWTVSNIT